MAHTERRGSKEREFLLGVMGGAIYGAAHTLSGHPLDNLKAKMQLDPKYFSLGTPAAARTLFAEAGVAGFFRGVVPPLIGSTIYRSAMMSSYEAAYTYFDQETRTDSIWKAEVLGGWFPRPMVLASTFLSSFCRSAVESPFEYMKVMRQTGRSWNLIDCYRGVGVQTLRTTGMLLFIFGPYDVIRNKTDLMSTKLGQFCVTSCTCASAYAIIWPLETLKNVAQSGLPQPKATVFERIAYLGGLQGLYRGALPGIICGGFRNGAAMVAMANYQMLATQFGLRN